MSDKSTKKPEKLASAVYLISSFFPDQEPMKWKLRSLATDFVSRSAVFKDGFSTDEKRASLDVHKIVSEMTGLLRVAKNAGLVSDANHDIIANELLSYINILELPAGVADVDGKAVLTIDFPKEAREEPVEKKEERTDSVKDKFVKDTEDEDVSEPEADSDDESEEPVYKTYISERSMAAPKAHVKGSPLKQFGAVSTKKSNRKSVIIGLLKRKKEIMIKDVSPLISGCSEKTIQRELLGLVKEGVLKKEGEKRWSKYSLA